MGLAAKPVKGFTMRFKFKIIGFALVAICAMNAIAAEGVQAKTFDSEVQTTYYTGAQVGSMVFLTTGGPVKCKKVDWIGEATATGGGGIWTRETIELTPTPTECTGFGQTSTTTAAGCEFTFNANGTLVSITGCTAGAIVIHVPSGNCTITIPNQHFTEALVSYANEGAGSSRDILVTTDVTSKITYIVHGPGMICGTPGHYTDGSLTGSFTLKGYKNAAHTEQVGIWVT
jgi:hypothetical protein